MKHAQRAILKPDYIGTGISTSKDKNPSREDLRNKFLQRAADKHHNLLTRLSRT